MQAKNFLTLDTETTGLGEKAIVFDMAYVIANRKTILCERSFLIREVITSPRMMLGALNDEYWRAMFGGKLFRHYIPALHHNEIKIFGWRDAIEIMRDDMRTYNVQVFAAYNLEFDKRAMGKTQHKICNTGRVLEYKPQMLCLWDFACSSICNTQLYHDVANYYGVAGGWKTEAGNVKTTAEKVHAYLSGNHNFIESHTALEDAQIETEILQRLLARKKTIPYDNPDLSHPWRRAQQTRGRLI